MLRIHIADLARGLGLAGRQIESRQLTTIRQLAIDGANEARRIASAYTPPARATGAYMRGWRAYHYKRHSVVGNSKAYSVYVESGRRAGAKPPPVEAIRKWLKVKGKDPAAAYAVARKIGRDGIAARPVQPALIRWLAVGLATRMPPSVKKGAEEGFRMGARRPPDQPLRASAYGGGQAGGMFSVPSVANMIGDFYAAAGRAMIDEAGGE